MIVLNINTDALVKHSARLEQLRKSALPSAVRGTLNNLAFDVKQRTMPAHANSTFIKRSPNFFKANSRVEMATGNLVNSMRSSVGFFSNNLRSDKGNPADNYAVKDLEQQEHGGRISGKSFIPLDTARTGGHASLVKPANRLTRILPQNKLVIARNLSGTTKKEKFVKAIFKAGIGGYVLGSNIMGENLLWRVESLSEDNGTKKFRLTPLYSYSKKRKISVKETSFMMEASMDTTKKADEFYIKNAEFWINKYMK
jgi:hypothetical protein